MHVVHESENFIFISRVTFNQLSFHTRVGISTRESTFHFLSIDEKCNCNQIDCMMRLMGADSIEKCLVCANI